MTKETTAKDAVLMFINLNDNEKHFILGYMSGVQQSKESDPKAS